MIWNKYGSILIYPYIHIHVYTYLQSFETVMQALVDGKPIDLSNMPPPLLGNGEFS